MAVAAPVLVVLAAFLALPAQPRAVSVGNRPPPPSFSLEDGRADAEDQNSACRPGNISGSGWQVAEQTASGDQNVCMHGKLVPQLYVLGAPKCATTSFASEFSGGGGECAAATKEYDYWTVDTIGEFWGHQAATISAWEMPLEGCDKSTRRVVADYTPEYLSQTFRNTTDGLPEGQGLPAVLDRLYGRILGRSLQFVVMVREPLSRMQSWWYYTGNKGPFQPHAEDEVRTGLGSVWHSKYGHHMQEWTATFNFIQFYVIPFRLFSGPASQGICDNVSARLNFRVTCAPVAVDALHGSHPSLEADTTEEFRDSFAAYMAPDLQLLVEVLAVGSTKGMGLPQYQGEPGSEAAIGGWLVKNW